MASPRVAGGRHSFAHLSQYHGGHHQAVDHRFPDHLSAERQHSDIPSQFQSGILPELEPQIQHEFSPTLVAQVGYVGTHGVHMDMGVNINGSAPDTGTAGRQLYPYVTSDMNMYEPFGYMTYNALQASLRKRIGASIIGASYTFSKSINNTNGDNGDGTLWRAYPVSFALDKQVSGFNRPQNLQIYYVYQLPLGKGHSLAEPWVASWIVGNWQLSGTSRGRADCRSVSPPVPMSTQAARLTARTKSIQTSRFSAAMTQTIHITMAQPSPIRQTACSVPPATISAACSVPACSR